MAHKVRYKFNGVAKEISFSYSRHQNMHEAVADAEGLDLTHFLQTEQRIASISKGKATVRNFRGLRLRHRDVPNAHQILTLKVAGLF